MTDGTINKVLYNVDQRANTTEAEKKTARDNIGAVGLSDIEPVMDERYKLLQQPINASFASFAVIDRYSQTSNGVVDIHCSYIYPSTESANGLMSAGDKTKLDNIPYNAEPNVQSDWDETDPNSDAFIKNKPDLSVYATKSELTSGLANKQDTLTAGSNITISNNVISATAAPQQQADWTQSDTTAVDYIKNKPQNLVQDANYVHTDNNFTTAEKTKLSGIAAGAEVNVQANWNETDTSADSYIQNKPANLVQDANYVHTDNNFTTSEKTKLAGIQAGAEQNVQSDWNQTDNSADDFIKNKPQIPVVPPMKDLVAGSGITLTEGTNDVTIAAIIPDVPELSWQQETQGASNSFPADQLKIHQDYHTVTMHTTGGSDVQLGYVVPNPQSADDGKVLKAINDGVGGAAITWGDAPNADWNASSGASEILNKPAIPTAGRNLNLNQYNAMQTDLPGGTFDAPANQSNNFVLLTDADFAGSYRLACRHNTSDNYELAIAYTASGMSSSYSFIGTETVVATDNSVTTKQAVYLGETCVYTPTTKFGGVASTAFDPTRHKAIIYDGIAQIGPTSDCKIAIYSDANSNVKIAFTAIEVAKVGSTT